MAFRFFAANPLQVIFLTIFLISPFASPLLGNEPVAAGRGGSFSADLLFWNIESEGNAPAVIARELEAFRKYGVVGLVEVLPENFSRYQRALGKNFTAIGSRSGNRDRLMILFDRKKFREIRHFELDAINIQGRYRAPLVVHLKHLDSGVEFLVMNNHLARSKAEIRQRQSQMLVDWVREQTLPVVAIGDYNFDYEFSTGQGNEAFRVFMRDNLFRWVQPVEWIDSNWYDPEGDGLDNYPGSLLDFAFLAGPARGWKAECRVIVRPGDFPDGKDRSDHRPVELRVQAG